jgi:hypothetical protein
MSERPRNEKEEKSDEKDMEKREEKSPEEKNWEEKYRRDPLGSIIWALILIWIGVVFLAANLNYLDRLVGTAVHIEGLGFLDKFVSAWSVVLLGMGVILLIEVLIRLLVPAYRRPVTGTIILAVIFIGISLGDLVKWDLIWPVILIILGVSFLMRGLLRKK